MDRTGYVRCKDCCNRIRDTETGAIIGCRAGEDWYRCGERVPCSRYRIRLGNLTVSPGGIEPKDSVFRCVFCDRSFTGNVCPECGMERIYEDDELIEDEYNEEDLWEEDLDYNDEEDGDDNYDF